jgi:hypothetical protein
MSIQCCSSCGRFSLRRADRWAVVDPERPRPAEWLCAACEEAYEHKRGVFVYTDRHRHIATLLSDSGLRAARHDLPKSAYDLPTPKVA